MSGSWPPPFVSAEQLRAELADAVLVDVRWSEDGEHGRRAHLEATIPGAVFADFDALVGEPPARPTSGRRPLASPERFAASLGELGIAPGQVVVAFDQGPGQYAARLVWMLRAIGQPAAVLDGGLAGWTGSLEAGGAHREPVRRDPVPWPGERLADADEITQRVTEPGVLVIDARSPSRYRGEQDPGSERPGHVPGAVSAPYLENLREGRMRPPVELRERYERLGALGADEVIVYCGSGVTACHDLLALESLGIRGRLYPGSWSAWSADPSRPVATGPEPGTP